MLKVCGSLHFETGKMIPRRQNTYRVGFKGECETVKLVRLILSGKNKQQWVIFIAPGEPVWLNIGVLKPLKKNIHWNYPCQFRNNRRSKIKKNHIPCKPLPWCIVVSRGTGRPWSMFPVDVFQCSAMFLALMISFSIIPTSKGNIPFINFV